MSRPISVEEIVHLAKTAAKRYLESGTSLNDSIRKLAADNSLNPHQTTRVAEAANLCVHNTLWKAASHQDNDRAIEFEIARPDEILESGPMEKESAVDWSKQHLMDYLDPPDIEDLEKCASADLDELASLMGVDGKDHRSEYLQKRAAVRAKAKVNAYKERVMAKLAQAHMQHEAAYAKLEKVASELLLRGLDYSHVYAAGIHASPPDAKAEARSMLNKVARQLRKKNRIKEADCVKLAGMPASDKDVSELLPPAQVVNGNHKFIKTLDAAIQSNRLCGVLERDLTDIAKNYQVDVSTVEL